MRVPRTIRCQSDSLLTAFGFGMCVLGQPLSVKHITNLSWWIGYRQASYSRGALPNPKLRERAAQSIGVTGLSDWINNPKSMICSLYSWPQGGQGYPKCIVFFSGGFVRVVVEEDRRWMNLLMSETCWRHPKIGVGINMTSFLFMNFHKTWVHYINVQSSDFIGVKQQPLQRNLIINFLWT